MKYFLKYEYELNGKIHKAEKMIECANKEEAKLLLYEQAVEAGVNKLDIDEIIPIAVLHESVVSEYEFYVERTAVGWRLKWNGLTFNASHIKVKHDECMMHLEITTYIPASKSEIIWQGKYNLYSERTTSELIKKCEEALPEKDFGINWKSVIQYWKKRLYELIKEGEPVEEVDVKSIEESTYSFLIDPFIIEDTINLIFAEGGTGKSSMALAFAMLGYSVELQKAMQIDSKPLNVLYLDYEHNKLVFKNFLRTLSHSYNIQAKIKYRPCHVPLQIEFESIAHIVTENEIDLIIIDSLAPASGEVVEVSNIVNFYQCLQKLRKTILLIGHTPKNSDGEMVFGSVFFHNLARNIWQLKKRITGIDSFQVIFTHKKCNLANIYKQPFVYELTYQNGGVSIKRVSIEEAEEDASPPAHIICQLLKRRGALTPKEIERETGLNYNTVRVYLRRLLEKGIIVSLRDGSNTLYALKSDEPF